MNRHIIALATLALASAPVVAEQAPPVDWSAIGYDASYPQGAEEPAAMSLDREEEGPWPDEGPFLPRRPHLAADGERRPVDIQN